VDVPAGILLSRRPACSSSARKPICKQCWS
jgi:hypothetical protein